jgi:4-amino-4-deoxy-L-arabinose transferase-like glycosyltransferase
MITFFPNLISRKAITGYFIALAFMSVVFIDHVLPLYMLLFGTAEVCLFFAFSHQLTLQWYRLHPKTFAKKLFVTSLIIRLVYMLFAYFFYDYMTGQPFMFHSADEQLYYNVSKIWREQGYSVFINELKAIGFSDSGEIWWNGLLCLLFGHYILVARIGHCLTSALTCVLIYRIAKRHFGERTARISAIFCMLMPNLIYYCGMHLKEANMVFATVLLVDSVDALLSESKFNWTSLVTAVVATVVLFSFRTPLGIVGVLATMVAIVLNKGKLTSLWKKVGLAVLVVAVVSTTAIGNRLKEEVDELWAAGETNQSVGMEYRAKRVGGNSFAKNASAIMFAPAIFTIPFSSMVYTENQENQQMIHGGNFVKNVLSGFVIFAVVILIFSGDWRKHTLPLALMLGYLAVIAFSNFAHSERFHQPALPFELMFAAYGISQLQQKHVKWIDYWMVFVIAANVGWAWIKLAGRGML